MTHKIGTICYATDQGIGILPKQFYNAGVITDVMMFRHSGYVNHREWYPPSTTELVGRPFNGPVVEAFIRSVDAMLFFETPFDWSVIDLCKRLGTRTVLVPMYECTPHTLPYKPDKFICPSLLDVEYFQGSPYLPVPVCIPWEKRSTALRFLHNGGHLGLRGHKGTLEILQAVRLAKKPFDITIRAQDVNRLRGLVYQVFGRSNDIRLNIQYGELPREQLFKDHDVFIMAEKYNGLSLPLAEARASGMLVMTSDRFPMNTWLDRKYLIPVSRYQKARVGPGYNVYDEAIIKPEDIAAKLDEVYGQDISSYSLSGRDWAKEMSWDNLKDKWITEVLG